MTPGGSFASVTHKSWGSGGGSKSRSRCVFGCANWAGVSEIALVIFYYKPGPAGAQRRRRAKKQIGGRMGHGLLKTAAAWSILRLVMVNRYTFVVVNRECGTGESLHIRHGQS